MLRLIVPALIAALLAGCAPEGPPRFHGTTLDDAPPAPDFNLTDHTGKAASLADYRGEPVLLFFGFTHCPDVCPLTLDRLARTLEELGPRARDVRVLLVSVDPARDTPPVLAQYVRGFGERVAGLTGTPEALQQVRSAYNAHAEPTVHDGHPGMMHTDAVYGIDREGRLRVLMAPDAPEEQFRDDLRTLLRL